MVFSVVYWEAIMSKKQNSEMLHEAVGVFDNVDDLQHAIDQLQENGFMAQELSVLSDDKTVKNKLGKTYKDIQDAEDDPRAPRSVFIPRETAGDIEGVLIALPLYLSAVITAVSIIASGGSFMNAITGALVAGIAGAAIGYIFARLYDDRYHEKIHKQLKKGGLLLWVHLRSKRLGQRAKKILKQNHAHDIHIHEIAW